MHARGWHFHNFFEPDLYRLMCSWASTEKEIAEFVADLQA
jgi:threonine aldolase